HRGPSSGAHLRWLRACRLRAPLRRARPRAVDHAPDRRGAERTHLGRERAARGRAFHRRAAAMSPTTEPTIFVIDDDHDIRAALAETLRDEGYSVVCARDAADALDKLRAMPPKPDALL